MTTSSNFRRLPIAGPDGRPPTPAFYAAFWPPHLGSNGIVTYVDNIAAGLRARGVRPVVLAPQVGPPRAGDPPVVKVSDPPTRWRRLSSLRPWRGWADSIAAAARRATAEHGVDLLEIEESFGWAAEVKSRVRVPMAIRLHCPCFLSGGADGVVEDDAFRGRVANELKGILAADAVSAPSRDVLERTRRLYGVPLEDAVVIPNPGPEVPPERLWRLDDADRGTIAFVGRFDRLKGGDVMIDAFARVAANRPDVRLLFAGADLGMTGDDGRRWDLAGYVAARAPEAADRIEVLGRVPAGRVADLRRRALATVVASRYETFGYTVLEAAAQGAPLVASDVGGIPEVVRDGESALLVPPADPDALAAALLRLLDDPLLAARLGAAAADRARREFGADVVASRTLEFHGEILARRGANR